ncbi:MAG: alanine glycine permease, partial [Flavobacteriales bacterium]|nr:alanine glycine permease [Flavobacteriales bacterium]
MLKVKLVLLTLFSFLIPFITFAQETAEKVELTIDQKIDAVFKPFADAVSSVIFYTINLWGNPVPLGIIILIAGAIFFTVYFKFANFTLIGTAVKVVKG